MRVPFLATVSGLFLLPVAAPAAAPVDTAGAAVFHQQESAPRPAKFRPWSVTLSPVWALVPMFNGTVEYQPTRYWGVAAKTHFGAFEARTESDDDVIDLFYDRYRVFALGGEARYYPYGRGFHLAGGTSWWRVAARDVGESPERGSLWMANALLGWKGVTQAGFTGDIQLGATMRVAEPGLMYGENWLPLLRVNLGWSF